MHQVVRQEELQGFNETNISCIFLDGLLCCRWWDVLENGLATCLTYLAVAFLYHCGEVWVKVTADFSPWTQQWQHVGQAQVYWERLCLCQRSGFSCSSSTAVLINLHFLLQTHIPFILTAASCRICFIGLQPAPCPVRLGKVQQRQYSTPEHFYLNSAKFLWKMCF